MKRVFYIAVFLLLLAPVSFAACSGASPTWTAASPAAADVQACITLAVNGDTVLVPSGTMSSGTIDIPNTKYITVNGQGGVTVTTSPGFTLEPASNGPSRITGFTFTNGGGQSGDICVQCTGTPIHHETDFTYRIDNNTFTAGVIVIALGGNGPGLIDHNTFINGGGNDELIHNLGTNDVFDGGGWSDNIYPGGSQMVFIEDNTFQNPSGNPCVSVYSAIQGYYGARTVARHNTIHMGLIDQHGFAPGSPKNGARWYELYQNTFTADGCNQYAFFDIRAGSGVIWGNVVTNQGTGTRSFLLRESGSGAWPNAWQVGSGINGNTGGHSTCASGTLNSSPLYLWATDPAMVITPSGTVQQNRDFFVSTSQPSTLSRQEQTGDTCSTVYDYVPYTYPHPLQGGFIPTSRTATGNWRNPGIPGGIPSATFPLCTTAQAGVTLPYAPIGGGSDDSTNIQTAINNCPAGSVIVLTSGTFTLHRASKVCVGKSDDGANGVGEYGLCVTGKSNVLRGAGPQSTVLNYGDGGGIISMGQLYLSASNVVFIAVTSTALQGATTLTLANTTNVTVNSYVVVTQTNPTDTDGNPLVQIGGYGGSCTYCGHDLPNNVVTQIDKVTAINGLVITLETPLFTNFVNSPQVFHLPMIENVGVENLRVVGTAQSGTGLTYKNVNMEACAHCWIHNVESDKAVDKSNFYWSDTYAGEISNNYANDGFNHNSGADYSLLCEFRCSNMLIANNIIRKARHSTPESGGSGNVYIYNYEIDAYMGDFPNSLPETEAHTPHPMFNIWEGNVTPNWEFDFAHGSNSNNTMFRNYINMTSTNPNTGLPMTGGLIAINNAYYATYDNIVGNVLGPYPTGCNASTYETDAPTSKVNGVIFQWGYFDDGGGSSPNLALSDKTRQTALLGGNWDCVNSAVLWYGGIPSANRYTPSGTDVSYLAQQTLPSSLVYSTAPSYFSATGAVWPPIDTGGSTKVNQIPAQICYNAPGGPNSSLQGNFNPTACYVTQSNATAQLTPSSLSFGNQAVGVPSSSQAVTLTNVGAATLSINSISFTGTNPGDFTQSNNCPATLGTNSFCIINVTFNPTTTGARSASLSVSSNDPNSPATAALSGTGIGTPAVTLNPTSLSFGNQPLQITSSAQNVTLTNSGTGPLTINSIALTGSNSGDYAISNNTCGPTLSAGSNCVVSVTFTPTAVGSRTASLTFSTNASTSPDNATLSGTGQAPIASFSPSSLSFGGIKLGLSSVLATTLTNTGNAAMSISSITITGANVTDYSQVNTCPASLAINANCTITTTFAPVGLGNRTASISVSSNTATSPDTVPLTGLGFYPITGTGTLSGSGTIKVQP